MIPKRNEHSAKSSRKQRELEARRQSILTAAGAIFKQQGFHNATMAAIASAAEFGIGTIYQFFPNKQRLFEEVVRHDLDKFNHGLRAAMADVSGWQDKLKAFISYSLRCSEAEPELPKIIMDVMTAPEADIASHLMEMFMTSYRESIAVLMGICEDGFQGQDEKIKELAPLATLGIVHAIGDERNRAILKQKPTDYIETLYQMITKILGG